MMSACSAEALDAEYGGQYMNLYGGEPMEESNDQSGTQTNSAGTDGGTFDAEAPASAGVLNVGFFRIRPWIVKT